MAVQMLDYEHLFISLTSSFHQEKREEKGYLLQTAKIDERQISITVEFSPSRRARSSLVGAREIFI